MLCAYPGEGEESPHHRGVEYADNGPVAHHSILQDDFYKNTPQPFGNIVVRKVSVLGKYRKNPPIKRFQEQPNTCYGRAR